MEDYIEHYNRVESFFQYDPFHGQAWQERSRWLSEHPIKHREMLAEGLKAYNRQVNDHPAVMQNIEKLGRPDAFVVIGGQQAGILTGPLLVIHKAITLLKLASKAQQETGQEVIPVFWIASEDHDYEEVNHVYVPEQEQAKKIKLPFYANSKKSISELEIPNESLVQIVEEVFSCFPDRPQQKQMKDMLYSMAQRSDKLNDFFARIMGWLFGHHGLVLVDSADPIVRELEKPVFAEIMKHDFNPELAEVQKSLIQSGYHCQLDIQEDQSHFFLIHNGERQLMHRRDGQFVTKDGSGIYSQQELQKILEATPTRFSANVVSRPVMQEHLFPVLAFVGGPGEIAYWAQLKPVFQHFGMQMPIIFPRLTFTLIERDVEKYMKEFQLNFEQACYHLEEHRAEWLNAKLPLDLEGSFGELKEQMERLYQPFVSRLAEMEPGVRNLGESNMERILSHIEFLQKRTRQAIEHRHQAGLRQWDRIHSGLYPLEKPQERVYNVLGYLNHYGMDLVGDILRLDIPLNTNHKLIYI